MQSRSRNRRRIAAALWASPAAAVIAVAGLVDFEKPQRATAAGADQAKFKAAPLSFDKDGQLLQPQGYRHWPHVGTPLTPNDMNGGQAAFPEFHTVYINPEGYREYEKTGKFPEGTVLVKELISVGSKAATSGKGYFMGDFIGLEVAVKDKARFPDEPGHWAYFSFGHEYPLQEQARAQPVANCSVCHGANADDDYVFTQYYPVLRAAKESATD